MKRPELFVAVRMVDLARGLQPLTGLGAYMATRVFVSDGDALIGAIDLDTNGADGVSVERLRDAIGSQLGVRLIQRDLRARLARDGRRPRLPPTTVSIIVPTCDREHSLRRCLTSLTRQRTRHAVEVVVVDNRPQTGDVRRVTAEYPSVRVVDERRPGLSYARNAGILHATGDIIVATDDDVVAPETWIERLLEPFGDPDVRAVTGHVLPLRLDSAAQYRFEAYGGLGKGFDAREFDAAWFVSRRAAVPTWEIGATANAAFRASLFREPSVGLLDEALGAGTPTGCSEDTDLFYRILASGGRIVYTPDAFVWHDHRGSMRSLRRQIYGYSKGHVAYHLSTLLRYGDRRALWRLGYSLPKTFARRAVLRVLRRSDYPLSLIVVEIAGTLTGPFALWRSRRRARRLGRCTPPMEMSHAVPLEGSIAQDPSR